MTRLNNKEVRQLRVILNADQLPEGATYYMYTSSAFGRIGEPYYVILDSNLQPIENVCVKYPDSLHGLTQVTTPSDRTSFRPAELVYHLVPIEGTEFFICESVGY